MRHSKRLRNEHCKKFKNESIYDFCKLGDEFVLQALLLLYKMHSYPSIYLNIMLYIHVDKYL
jgi:hypothetical protein